MDALDFLSYRVAFSGLPYGELRGALARVAAGEGWGPAMEERGRSLRRMAGRRLRSGSPPSAADAWLWAACAYQAASLELHLQATPARFRRRTERFRLLARGCYRRALTAEPHLAQAVEIPCDGRSVAGYLRLPAAPPRLALVLFNGLDSVCEVEMHAFGDWMLRRGFAVLAVDLPAALTSRPRTPLLEVERAAPGIADWLEVQPATAGLPLAAFGVSFGGHLVARALAGEPRFAAGVAVSSGAWLDRGHLAVPRLRAMVRFAFDLRTDGELTVLALAARLSELAPPAGRLLALHMDEDALFGPEHCRELQRWGGERVEVRTFPAEHVGTSRVHVWLPEVCDWLETAAKAAGGEQCRHATR
jgi:Esterase FrsA-like